MENLLPVVIVGKDRTRMTCAVIDHLKEHIKNAKPYFICVSDQSRKGHDEAISRHLREIGETRYIVDRTHPEAGRFGLGAAMNQGLQKAFSVNPQASCALLVENDYLLNRDLDIDKYIYAFSFADVGAITFKHVDQGSNVRLHAVKIIDGSEFLLRGKGDVDRFSFTAEFGCALMTKRLIEAYGAFKENCRTDEAEWSFCNWYNSLNAESKSERQLWYANDRALWHTSLNGEGHVFTHVGMKSQHEGPHKWDVPDKYIYLSDEEEDKKACAEALGLVGESSKDSESSESEEKANESVQITGSDRKKKGRKFITVYAIAKNEASVAKRWWECVKEADEVCVLDTGSTDDTVKILRELGAKVEVKTYKEWSFAVARNDSMKMASPEADILFTLDLDETIEQGWRKKLEDGWIAEEMKGKKPRRMHYKYIWSFTPEGKEMQAFAVSKIHANGTGRWRYRCHELLTDIVGDKFFLPGFVVEHHQNRQTSRSQYIDLLKRDAEEMPDDDRSAYYYARELMYNQEWKDAIQEFKRHLTLKSAWWRAERASSMRHIARCYHEIRNEDERELWLWKAATEDPTNREATYTLGEMSVARNDWRTACRVLEKCVAIEFPSLEYISAPIVWTARPWSLYAKALWWTENWDAAIKAAKKATEIEPNNKELKEMYDNMTLTRGDK